MKTTTITTTWKTIAIVAFDGRVAPAHEPENRAAHGGVRLLQARRDRSGLWGRRVNSNGRHKEFGEPFALDAETLEHWQSIARQSR